MASDHGVSPLLELRLFGQPSVHVLGHDLTADLPKKAVLLLALLAIREGKPVERSHVASVLWPDVSDAVALHNLRQLLAGLRRCLGDARNIVQSPSPRTLSIEVSPNVSVDVAEFDEARISGDTKELDRALALYRDALLPDCDETFAVIARDVRQQQFLCTADILAEKYMSARDYSSAISVLRRALSEDPYRETACRSLMVALSATGQWPAALEAYIDFRARLRRELHVDVSAETKDLHRSIKRKVGGGVQEKRHKSVMPRPLTNLVGRERAISDVVAVLEVCRLVTLTGPGGVGKTRLSIAVANAIADKYLDGAFFIDLSPVQDEQTIPAAIATTLSLREVAGRTTGESITEHLKDRELLLVLDNCEHLTRPVAKIAEQLLLSSTGLRVLATSRQVLGVRGELVWGVSGLGTGGIQDKTEDLLRTDAVQLFLYRSRRTLDLTKDREIRAVASVCRKLDGMPLAIELAAARTNLFLPSDIERRLDDNFALLSSDAPSLQRHQTQDACIEWSWNLLSDDERNLLKFFSIFRGGCTLNTLQTVADGIAVVPDVLASLVDKSLVVLADDEEGTRYTLLATVREFANLKLRDSENWQGIYDRFRDHYLEWAEDNYRQKSSLEDAKMFATYEREHDNFRACIDWCHQQGHHSNAIRLCVALSRFWDTHGHLNEGRSQLELALSKDAPDLSLEIRGRALLHVAWMATVQGECEAAIKNYSDALKIAETREDGPAMGIIYNCLANAYMVKGDLGMTEICLAKALDIHRATGQRGVAMILCNLGEVAIHREQYETAIKYIEMAIEELGGFNLDNANSSGTALRHSAFINYRKGNYSEASDLALRSLDFFTKANSLNEVPFTLLVLALAFSGLEEWSRSVRLIGACLRVFDTEGTTLYKYFQEGKERELSRAREHLSAAEVDALLTKGKAMDLTAAIKFATRGS